MAHVTKITGEQPFQVEAHSFGISASGQGYVLNYSADGVHYTPSDTVDPNTEWGVACPRGLFYKLVGNTDDVTITY